MRHVRLKDGAELRRPRCSVTDQRNAPESDNDFGKQSLVQPSSSDSESRGSRWMRMANRIHIRPHVVKEKVHGQLGGKFPLTGKLPALKIGYHQIFWREHPLVHARRGGQNALLVQAHRHISLAGYVIALL